MRTRRDDHINLETPELRDNLRKSLGAPFERPVLDDDVPAFDIAEADEIIQD